MLEFIDYCQWLSRRFGYLLNGDSEEIESIAYEVLGELAVKEEIDISKTLLARALKTRLYDEIRRLNTAKRKPVLRLVTEQHRTTENFDDLIEDCTELQKQILKLDHVDGYSLGDIATVIGLSQRQVGYEKLKAHSTIRRRIDESDNCCGCSGGYGK